MKTTIAGALLAALALSVGEIFAADSPLTHGKQKTDRAIVLEVMVSAPPAEVFRLWTTVEGVKQFFAPAARIEPRVGGEYTIIFAPKEDPNGDSHGTNGARILKFVPGKELAFEWISFVSHEIPGKEGPPVLPSGERNARPLPTWVELHFEEITGAPGQTHLRFAHYGFREGEKWEQSQRWFSRVWKGVLDQLSAYCARQTRD